MDDPTGWSVHISNNGVAHAAPEQAAAMSVLPELIRAAAWMPFGSDSDARRSYVGSTGSSTPSQWMGTPISARSRCGRRMACAPFTITRSSCYR